MYITLKNINKNLGKFIELDDLIFGFPIFMLFLLLFSKDGTEILSLVVLVVGIFSLLPVNISNKNRMYKFVIMSLKYIFSIKTFIKFNEENEVKKIYEIYKKKKT